MTIKARVRKIEQAMQAENGDAIKIVVVDPDTADGQPRPTHKRGDGIVLYITPDDARL